MHYHIITTTDTYRCLPKKINQQYREEDYLNTMDWYEMDESKSITIAGIKFQVKGDVCEQCEQGIYRIARFQTQKKPTIWLKPYTFPSNFWLTQNG